MPAITWRDVAGANFSSSTDALRTASGLMDNAFSGLDRSIQKFEGAKDERALKEFEMRKLRYTDPEAFQAALQSGELFEGIDKNRLSAESIASTGQRNSQLLNDALSSVRLEGDRFNLAEDKGKVERLNAAAPDLQKAGSLFLAGKENEARALLQSSETVGKLRPDEFLKFATDGLGLTKDIVGIADDRQSISIRGEENERARWRYGNEQVTYAEQREAQDILARITAESGGDIAIARQLLQESPVSGNVYNLVMSGLGGVGAVSGASGASSEIGAALGSGSGDASAVRVFNFDAAGKGFASVPDSIKTLGQFVAYGKKLINNNGVKSTAAGVYQITQETMEDFGRQIWGNDWKNKEFNFETQDAVAKKIFESTGGSVSRLRGRWESLNQLTDAEVARLGKMPWEQAREIIAMKESSVSPAAILRGSDVEGPTRGDNKVANAAGAANRNTRRSSINDPVMKYYDDNKGKELFVDDVVGSLKKEDWSKVTLGGVSDSKITAALNAIVSRAKEKGIEDLNHSQAVGILRAQGVISGGSWNDWAFGTGTFNNNLKLSNNKVLDMSAVDSQLAKIRSGSSTQRAAARAGIGAEADDQKAAQEAFNRADAAYQAAKARRAGETVLKRLKAARDQAARAANALNERAATPPRNTSGLDVMAWESLIRAANR